MIPELLAAGPLAYGFEGNLWTCGVDFSQQRPRRQDLRQKPEKVCQWCQETLPELKKT